MKLKLLSLGCNRKLDKKVAVFNLPQGKTCPGATELCRRICYAAKAERMYPQAAAMRERNLIASKELSFVVRMIEEIDYLIKTKGLSKVRLFESGDLYSAEFCTKILEICRESPEVTFLMYTKSFHLAPLLLDKPANLKVYWSIDSSTRACVPPGVTARIVLKGEQPAKGEVTCIHSDDKHYCGSQCFTCWKNKVPVYFLAH